MRGVLAQRADLVSGVLVLLTWYLVAQVWHPLWLPTLPSVLREMWTVVSDGTLSVLGTTATTLVMGLAVVFGIAAVFASVMAAGEIPEQSLLPFVNGFMAVPHIALIPMFTFIWGNGELTRVITTISFAFSPVVLTWLAALKSPPAELMEMAAAFGAGSTSRLRYVRIPNAAAPLLAGVRIGVVQGIKGVISAEVLIGVVGVGKVITTNSQTFDIPQLYAVVLVIILLSIASYLLLSMIENRMTRWNE
jgi:ABC-type nitrate/sulfonate/bicarbonate transport system permease component